MRTSTKLIIGLVGAYALVWKLAELNTPDEVFEETPEFALKSFTYQYDRPEKPRRVN